MARYGKVGLFLIKIVGVKKMMFEERILKVLKEAEDWVIKETIRKETNIHIYKIDEVLKKLLEEGKIEKDKRGRFTFWKLK